jgi:hypothetical protein
MKGRRGRPRKEETTFEPPSRDVLYHRRKRILDKYEKRILEGDPGGNEISAEDQRELFEISARLRFPYEMGIVEGVLTGRAIRQLVDERKPHIRARLKLMQAMEKYKQATEEFGRALEEYRRLTNSLKK